VKARPRKGSTATLAVAGVAALVTAACTPREHRTPDDTLVVLIEASMRSADPRYAVSSYDLKLSRLVAPGLIAVDTDDLAPRLELAERIDQLDTLTWDVTLRADARFSDGTPVTADDVVWTYQTVLAPDSDSLFHKQWAERFTSIEALDPRRVRLHLVAPLATLITDLDFGIAAHHAAGPDGKFAGGRAVGAGPYAVTELGPDRVVLVANRYWHGGAPAMPRVVIKTVRDSSARTVMLVGGSADLIQNGVRYDVVDDVLGRERVREIRGPSNLLTYMLLNNDDPILDDVRVRRAIALALDRPAIIAHKFAGRAVPATGLLPPNHWAYKAVDPLAHDPEAAKRLLDEAGYPDPDGDGPRPRLSLTYKTSADQFRVAVARVLAAQLAQVGIAVEVRPFEFATFFPDIKKGAYQIATMQTTDITEPDMYFPYFHSSRIPDAKNPDLGNRWRLRDPEIDALIEAGRRELDREQRKVIYGKIQERMAELVPVVPLWHEDNVVLVNRAVEGYRVPPNARLSGLAQARKR